MCMHTCVCMYVGTGTQNHIHMSTMEGLIWLYCRRVCSRSYTSWCFNDVDGSIRVSLFKFAINTRVEVTVNMLENESRIENYFGKLERLFKRGANLIGTGAKCCIYQK